MAIELSDITFTQRADIVPLLGTEEIVNTGTANTLAGADQITGAASGFSSPGFSNGGAVNTGFGDDIITGSGGLYNTRNGAINTGFGNDIITGTARFAGIVNDGGTINTGFGNDVITGTGEASGILNDGIINTGLGDDIITGTGSGGTGIVNNGTINTGLGADTITGTVGASGILNDGIINTGLGNDIVDALNGGFEGNGFMGNGFTILGGGNDLVKGFGTGHFDGGNGKDMMFLGTGTYNVLGTADPAGFYTVTNGNKNMLVKNFEFIGNASSPDTAFCFSSVIGSNSFTFT